MTSTQVRAAQPADIPLLVALTNQFYAESGLTLPAAPATHTFGQLLSEPERGRVWVLEWDAQPVGYIVLTVCFSMEYGGLRGFVDDLFVQQPYRGRGLGTAALVEVHRFCTALGVRALFVETDPTNETAQQFYRRRGFGADGRLLLALPLASPLRAS